MLTLCISHLQSEVPKSSSSSSRRHQQAAGFLTKGLFSYHLCLTEANKRKVYILKIVPEDSISLIYLGSLLFGMEKRNDPLNEKERDAPKCTEAAFRNYTVQREKHYWKTKRDFGFLHFIYAWTQNLFPSHLHTHCPFQPVTTTLLNEVDLQWSTSFCTKVSDTQLLHTRVEVGKNLDC